MRELTANQKTAQFFFALGHPRRLRIIKVLTDHPAGLSCEAIERLARIPRSSLCHHLRFLKDAGVAIRTVQDRFSIYRLDQSHMERMMTTHHGPVGFSKAA